MEHFKLWVDQIVEDLVSWRRTLGAWLVLAGSLLFELAVFVGAAILIETGLLMSVRSMWIGYVETQVGQKFTEFFGSSAGAISEFLHRNLWTLSLDLTLTALAYCLMIAFLAQLISITRYFYDFRGKYARFFAWAAICLLINTVIISGLIKLFQPWPLIIKGTCLLILFDQISPYWPLALIFGAAPILVIFTPCFRLANCLVPDLASFLLTRIRIFSRQLIYPRWNRANDRKTLGD